jgi:hypothetical protein
MVTWEEHLVLMVQYTTKELIATLASYGYDDYRFRKQYRFYNEYYATHKCTYSGNARRRR